MTDEATLDREDGRIAGERLAEVRAGQVETIPAADAATELEL